MNNMNESEKQAVTVVLPVDLLEWIGNQAKAEDRSRNAQIRRNLEEMRRMQANDKQAA